MVDCERGLGRHGRALDLAATPEAATWPSRAHRAGHRRLRHPPRPGSGRRRAARAADPGAASAAPRPACSACTTPMPTPCSALGREDEAREWFAKAAEGDTEGETDAVERLEELDGVDVDLVTTRTRTMTSRRRGAAPRRPATTSRAAGGADGVSRPRPRRALRRRWSATSTASSTAARAAGAARRRGARRPRRAGLYATNNASRRPATSPRTCASSGLAVHRGRRRHQLAGRGLAARASAAAPGAPVLARRWAPASRRPWRRPGCAPCCPAEPPTRESQAVLQGYGPAGHGRRPAEAALRRRRPARRGWRPTPTARCPPTAGWRPATGRSSPPSSAAVGRAARPGGRQAARRRCTCCAPSGSACRPSRVLAVGDRLDTDIAGAVAAGMDSLLVLTGVDDLGPASTHRRTDGRPGCARPAGPAGRPRGRRPTGWARWPSRRACGARRARRRRPRPTRSTALVAAARVRGPRAPHHR